MLESRFNTD